jgi:hypothetical protein
MFAGVYVIAAMRPSHEPQKVVVRIYEEGEAERDSHLTHVLIESTS